MSVVLVTVDTGHSFPKKHSENAAFVTSMDQQLFRTFGVMGMLVVF